MNIFLFLNFYVNVFLWNYKSLVFYSNSIQFELGFRGRPERLTRPTSACRRAISNAWSRACRSEMVCGGSVCLSVFTIDAFIQDIIIPNPKQYNLYFLEKLYWTLLLAKLNFLTRNYGTVVFLKSRTGGRIRRRWKAAHGLLRRHWRAAPVPASRSAVASCGPAWGKWCCPKPVKNSKFMCSAQIQIKLLFNPPEGGSGEA